MHARPEPGFAQGHGAYKPLCRSRPIPRFRCRVCRRTFSRQTFRFDYGDHKPACNAKVFFQLCSGTGLRQTARLVGMTKNNTARKFRKMGRHAQRLNRNLRADLPETATVQLDEIETYEERRTSRPLTLPILIERESRFMLGARAAPIRPSGKITPRRARAIAADEARFGRRPSRSRAAVHSVLRRGAQLCGKLSRVLLETDEKSTYPALAKRAFGAERLDHQCTPSTLGRGTWNPLFPINHTEAMARNLTGRLRRESWLVSKRRWFLNRQLALYCAYRNFVRPRFNRDRSTPAQLLGWLHRPLTANEVFSWRQDWGTLSGHPVSRDARAIREALAATA